MTAEELVAFKKAPITFRDEIWTRAGEHIIKAHKPNLLLFHLLTTDSSQHRYGARSLGGDTALSHADAKVARLVEACRQAGILDKTTFVIVSDHGFRTVKRSIRANVMLKAKGLDGSAWVIPEGGTAMVYATRAADKAKTIAAMKELFTGAEGIAQVLTPAEFTPLGYPSPDANPRMADLVLAAAEGFAFDGSTEGAADRRRAGGRVTGVARISQYRRRHARDLHRVGRGHQAGRETRRDRESLGRRRRSRACSGSR